MTENRVVALRQKGAIDDPLTEILRTGARRLIAQAVEASSRHFWGSTRNSTFPDGRRRVVRHGHDPVRAIQTRSVRSKCKSRRPAIAPLPGERIRFTSNILPKWARRTKSLGALLPVLYLRGISAGDFQEALAALLGKDAPNLSAAVIARLKSEWEDEYRRWRLFAGAHGAAGRMHAGADGGDAGGQEGADRLSGRHAGERAKLEGAARRFEARRPVDVNTSHLARWRAQVLEGPRRGVPDASSSAMLAAQDIERARQAPRSRCNPTCTRITVRSGCLRTGARRKRR